LALASSFSVAITGSSFLVTKPLRTLALALASSFGVAIGVPDGAGGTSGALVFFF